MKAIAEQHGGTVTIDDAPIGGARFIVQPARRPERLLAPDAAPSSSSASTRTRGCTRAGNGVCAPYDLVDGAARLRRADVIVLQESLVARRRARGVVRRSPPSSARRSSALPLGRGARSIPGRSVRRGPRGSGTTGIAILSRLPTTAWPTAAASASVFADPTPERGALHIELDVDGTTVDLVGVHLSSRLPYGPPIQLRRLAPQLPPPGRPAVVAGDRNFWGPGVRHVPPGWRRAVRGRTWPASRAAQPDRPHPRAPRRSASSTARCSATSAPTTARCERRCASARTRPMPTTVRGVGRIGARARRSSRETSSCPIPARARRGCTCRRAVCATPTCTTARARSTTTSRSCSATRPRASSSRSGPTSRASRPATS